MSPHKQQLTVVHAAIYDESGNPIDPNQPHPILRRTASGRLFTVYDINRTHTAEWEEPWPPSPPGDAPRVLARKACKSKIRPNAPSAAGKKIEGSADEYEDAIICDAMVGRKVKVPTPSQTSWHETLRFSGCEMTTVQRTSSPTGNSVRQSIEGETGVEHLTSMFSSDSASPSREDEIVPPEHVDFAALMCPPIKSVALQAALTRVQKKNSLEAEVVLDTPSPPSSSTLRENHARSTTARSAPRFLGQAAGSWANRDSLVSLESGSSELPMGSVSMSEEDCTEEFWRAVGMGRHCEGIGST